MLDYDREAADWDALCSTAESPPFAPDRGDRRAINDLTLVTVVRVNSRS